MIDGERGFVKYRGEILVDREGKAYEHKIQVRVVGYELNNELFNTLEKAYEARPFMRTEVGTETQTIYLGPGPIEVVEDVE